MQHYWSYDNSESLSGLQSRTTGLTDNEVSARLLRFGENRLVESKKGSAFLLLRHQYESPLVLILIFAAIISLVVKEWTEAIIIILIVLGSTLLGFFQEYRASQAVKNLRDRLALKVDVIRENQMRTIDATQIVPGDIVMLSAGNLIPADGIILEARDFLVTQASLTGESFPVEKSPGTSSYDSTLSERKNVAFLGTSVRSGTAKILVAQTGKATEFGKIAERLNCANPETDFERGMRKFGYLLTKVMMVIVFLVLTINLLLDRPVIDSLLFSVALAVGLTPELLPAIVSVTLSAGAKRMAKEGVIVRRLAAIENLGSATILCTDKTGTLTSGIVELSEAVNPFGVPSDTLFAYAATNSRLESGIKNPLDTAIVAEADRRKLRGIAMSKIDEIPYDFIRKRLTIVVKEPQHDDSHLIITKGAFDNVLECCSFVAGPDGPVLLDDILKQQMHDYYRSKGKNGYRVLGLATRRLAAREHYGREDEAAMVFEGFLLFFDPLKKGIEATIKQLGELGIAVKIITGDNRHVASHVAHAVGLDSEHILTGREIAETRDEALGNLAQKIQVFAEVDPQQKERIVRALQKSGHSVAYMGDGINDAPSLDAADVGISVAQAVDVARESADIVLLEQDLEVLRKGVIDGRKTFANTLKYVAITTSANFGNMISMAIATIFVPFLPLLAKQILLNNFLSDIPSIALSTDNVDSEATETAQRWNIRNIQHFMIAFGLISTLFDLLTFWILLKLFNADEGIFQSTWFVVSLLTELAVVLVLRSHLPSWKSRPSRLLMLSTLGVFCAAITLPYLGLVSDAFSFVPLPLDIISAGLLIVAAYIGATELAKRWFYRQPAA
jgi:Mg2+-importing ATPase